MDKCKHFPKVKRLSAGTSRTARHDLNFSEFNMGECPEGFWASVFYEMLRTLETKLSAAAESRLQAAVTRICKPPQGGTENIKCKFSFQCIKCQGKSKKTKWKIWRKQPQLALVVRKLVCPSAYYLLLYCSDTLKYPSALLNGPQASPSVKFRTAHHAVFGYFVPVLGDILLSIVIPPCTFFTQYL